MSGPLDQALTAACVLLTKDHFLVEALSAARRGRVWFRPDEYFEFNSIETAAHLDKVEMEATHAANMCANVGLTALANCCKKIADRILLAKRQGTDDCDALADLSKLTTAGRDALDAAEEIAAEYSRA